jgi:hypothetical protein
VDLLSVSEDGLDSIRPDKETPLDLSIAKARYAWRRIFEVKRSQYILFVRILLNYQASTPGS